MTYEWMEGGFFLIQHVDAVAGGRVIKATEYNFFEGRFSEDGNSYTGAWPWPGGGYTATLTRIN